MSAGGSVGGLMPQTGGASGVAPEPSLAPQLSAIPAQPAPPQQPGYNQITDYSLGFGRIFQQPSFYNPFAGYYGGGFGGPGMGFGGGFGGFGGGFGGGLGSLFGGYPSPPPLQFGMPYNPPVYRAPQQTNPYIRPRPLRDPVPEPMPAPPIMGGNDMLFTNMPVRPPSRPYQPTYDFGTPYVPPGGSVSPFDRGYGGEQRMENFGNQYLV